MNGVDVTVVRVYLRERQPGTRELLRYLHDESGVRGVTMFRAVMGYGADHEVHTSSLVALSLDLPVVVEFFDTPERIEKIVEHVERLVDPAHVVWWSARAGVSSAGD